MEPFTRLTGVAAALPQDDINTDQILPTAWLRDPHADMAEGLFGYLRRPDAQGQKTFILDQPVYRQTRILVVGQNFGCGSSREHAVWAFTAFGIRCLIARSFADVFRENCLRNGVLTVDLDADAHGRVLRAVEALDGAQPLTVDLEAQTIALPGEALIGFAIPAPERHALLLGLDDIGLTQQHMAEIEAWEARVGRERPFMQRLDLSASRG